jgi:hypothetical protein
MYVCICVYIYILLTERFFTLPLCLCSVCMFASLKMLIIFKYADGQSDAWLQWLRFITTESTTFLIDKFGILLDCINFI